MIASLNQDVQVVDCHSTGVAASVTRLRDVLEGSVFSLVVERRSPVVGKILLDWAG